MSYLKQILCLDFDGVVHSYTSGWEGVDVINDGPVEGVFDFIFFAQHEFEIHIFSSRSAYPEGLEAMRRWMLDHMIYWFYSERAVELKCFKNFPEIYSAIRFPTQKPPAFITIDDRTLTFDGTWPKMHDLLSFKSWNKKEKADVER